MAIYPCLRGVNESWHIDTPSVHCHLGPLQHGTLDESLSLGRWIHVLEVNYRGPLSSNPPFHVGVVMFVLTVRARSRAQSLGPRLNRCLLRLRSSPLMTQSVQHFAGALKQAAVSVFQLSCSSSTSLHL